MCSTGGHSNTKQPISRLKLETRDFDESQWMNVMQKGHQLVQQRLEQESILSIQNEVEVKSLMYPQSFIALKRDLSRLKQQHTLKIKTASAKIKQELNAAARSLQYKVENIVTDQYLYVTKT